MDRLLLDIGASSIKSIHQYKEEIVLDTFHTTESFSTKSVEYRNDVESITARIMESNAVLKKSNQLLSNLIEAGEEK